MAQKGDVQKLRAAVEDTADQIGGVIRHSYGGRGMYGKKCYGIVCDDATACIEEAATHGLTGAKIDSMGRQSIVYWEHVTGDDIPDRGED